MYGSVSSIRFVNGASGLTIYWTEDRGLVPTATEFMIFVPHAVRDALRDWFDQPKPPTPEERARAIIEEYAPMGDLGPVDPYKLQLVIEKAIRAAEEAARSGG